MVFDYQTDNNGIIQSPGKFEGQMIYVPSFYIREADDDCAPYLFYLVWPEDRVEFPGLLDNVYGMALFEDDQGFVTHFTFETHDEYMDALARVALELIEVIDDDDE